ALRDGFSRALVVDTGEGLAIFDSFNVHTAQNIRAAVAEAFPDTEIRWLVYSHYHLDHTRGGTVLEAPTVLAHHKCLEYWKDLDTDTVAIPTELLDGDQDLRLGNVLVRCLYLGLSHTDTLYGFHFPDHDVLFTADTGFVRALPPFGFPDWYHPGYIRALDRLAELPFDHFVPTHLERGTRDDLVDFRDMLVTVREAIERGLSRHGMHAANGRIVRKIYREEYPALRRQFGDWHGFDGMMLPLFFRQLGGVYLGF
ncbi:MAG: MBL fold metallo-hydrolase, partial [Beijerinckiaceae bacterium]